MKTDYVRLQIDQNREIVGVILPGETCAISPELAERKLKRLPEITPENSIIID